MAFELTNARYQGPIEKLVELIEQKKLSITEVSLAEVTGDFLAYVATLEHEAGESAGRAELLADFLVIASRLILIKSKALIPSFELTAEEAEDIRDLEVRVRLYRALKDAQPHLRNGWRVAPQMATRELFSSEPIVFYPPPNLTVAMLAEAAAGIAGELTRLIRPLEKVTATIIHLKEKIEEVVARVEERAFTFGELVRGKSRREAVVLFLALLHLVKSALVSVAQPAHFGDIRIAKRADTGDNG